TGLSVATPAFEDGATIPERHTCAGADASPPLRVEAPEASTLAVVLDDADADGFTHWTLWDVPAARAEIPAGLPRESIVLGAARQGRNDFGDLGYRGPCPPEGDDPHTYRLTLYGLDGALGLPSGVEPAAVDEALDNAALGSARLTGEFGR
ncbi:MAG: YbhB/YbcL family Raf kinase inhibitor-like protein, partial [Halobacteriaceae archaeon]